MSAAERAKREHWARRLSEDWNRRDEIAEFARRHGVPLDEAIRLLTNDGLSHYRGPSLVTKR